MVIRYFKLLLLFSNTALDEGAMSPPDEYTNQLRVVTHTKTPKEIGNVFMKAIVGISRLHSLKTMQV